MTHASDDAGFDLTDDPDRRSIRRRLRDVPVQLWLITALWGSLLLGASVLWPPGYGYDEANHVDMAYAYSAHPFHLYGPGQREQTPLVPAKQKMPFAGDPISPRS